jgi:hypothetical protein
LIIKPLLQRLDRDWLETRRQQFLTRRLGYFSPARPSSPRTGIGDDFIHAGRPGSQNYFMLPSCSGLRKLKNPLRAWTQTAPFGFAKTQQQLWFSAPGTMVG